MRANQITLERVQRGTAGEDLEDLMQPMIRDRKGNDAKVTDLDRITKVHQIGQSVFFFCFLFPLFFFRLVFTFVHVDKKRTTNYRDSQWWRGWTRSISCQYSVLPFEASKYHGEGSVRA